MKFDPLTPEAYAAQNAEDREALAALGIQFDRQPPAFSPNSHLIRVYQRELKDAVREAAREAGREQARSQHRAIKQTASALQANLEFVEMLMTRAALLNPMIGIHAERAATRFGIEINEVAFARLAAEKVAALSAQIEAVVKAAQNNIKSEESSK